MARERGVSSTGKCVLVTGASSGIGAAVAARFAREGAALILLGRDRQRLQRVADDLNASSSVTTIVVNLARESAIPGAIDKLTQQLQRLDVVVHAAGTLTPGSALSDSQRTFKEMLQVNVHAAMALTRGLLPLLKRSRGTLVFINSNGVQRPQRETAQYIACKHALRALADSLREELNPLGVRVTSVYPGRTATPMQQMLHQIEGRSYFAEELIQAADIAELVACAANLAPTAEVTDLFVRPRISKSNRKK